MSQSETRITLITQPLNTASFETLRKGGTGTDFHYRGDLLLTEAEL